MTPRRALLSGLLAGPVLCLALVALTVSYWPDWPLVAEAAQITDNAVPQIILAGLAGTLGLGLLHPPRGLLLLALAGFLLAAGVLVTRHVSFSLPLARDAAPDVTVLWFNVLAENQTDPARLVEALISSPADIVVLGEAAPLAGQIATLSRAFSVQAGCRDDTRPCRMMVLARHKATRAALRRIGRMHETRLAVVSATTDSGRPFTVVGMHLMKPWFRGLAETEEWQTVHTLRDVSGPLVAVGDLNAAPWSRRLRSLSARCGLMSARLPRPTWPVGAGWLGVPIDHVMVRGGARLTSLDTWGEGLGSNHLGLLAGVALPEDGAPVAAPRSCRPPRSRWDSTARGD